MELLWGDLECSKLLCGILTSRLVSSRKRLHPWRSRPKTCNKLPTQQKRIKGDEQDKIFAQIMVVPYEKTIDVERWLGGGQVHSFQVHSTENGNNNKGTGVPPCRLASPSLQYYRRLLKLSLLANYGTILLK